MRNVEVSISNNSLLLHTGRGHSVWKTVKEWGRGSAYTQVMQEKVRETGPPRTTPCPEVQSQN